MKKNKISYIIVLGATFFLYACQKHEIEVAPAKLAPVSDLKHELMGDTVLLTWALPKGEGTLTPVVYEGAASRELPANATSYKYGIVETNKDYVFTIKVKDDKGNISLGELVQFKREGADPVKDVSAVQSDEGVLVSWMAPATPVTKITVRLGAQTAELTGTATSHQFSNVPVGQYIISIVTTNSSNQVSNTVYLPFRVGATAVAYIGVYSDSLTLLATGDDDEIAGAKWLFKTYANAQYISFNEVKNGAVDLSQFRVIWWNRDLETTTALPAIATDADVVAKITAYYKGGGNLLLNQHAVQYFWTLGRFSEPYHMAIGGGSGFSNGDTWGIGVNINKKHDQSGHPLFKGITMTAQPDGRITFPVIGPGHREDHNAAIVRIPEYLKLEPNNNEAAYNKFVSDNNLEWLGQWDGIGDYWMAGIMELKPKDDFQGSALYIGIGGIEWNQNSGTNLYQETIEKMYKNALDYLKTK